MVRAMKPHQKLKNTLCVRLVQIACRFVGQQQRRPVCQRTCNRNSLLFPAR